MALFKVSKGSSSGLAANTIQDGFCWYTPDDGKFYIDNFSYADTIDLYNEITNNNSSYFSSSVVEDNTYYKTVSHTKKTGSTFKTITGDIAQGVDLSGLYIAENVISKNYAINSGSNASYIYFYYSTDGTSYNAVGPSWTDYYNYIKSFNYVFEIPTGAQKLQLCFQKAPADAGIFSIRKLSVAPRNALSAIPVSYGVCATGTNTVTIPGISLTNGVPPEGAMICVKFMQTNLCQSKSIIVNNGYINSNSIAILTSSGENGYWQANEIVPLVYNGTNWIIQSINILERSFPISAEDSSYSLLFSEQTIENSSDHKVQVIQKSGELKYYPTSGKTATTSLALGNEQVLLEYNSSSQTLNFVFN